jgi:ABC-2 type transport system permease protein
VNALIVGLELRRSRVLLFWLALTVVLYGGLMAAYYPQLSSDTAMIDEIVKRWPKEMLTAFGITNDLGLQGTYMNVYVLSMIWPIVAAIGAILIATRAVAADHERGFLELSLAAPISRTRYLLSSIAGQVVVLAILAAATVGAIAVVLPIVGVAIDPIRYLLVALLAFAFACAIASGTTLLAVLTLNRARSGGAVAGIVLLMYLAQTASKLVEGLAPLSTVSLFRYFFPADVIDRGVLPLSDLAMLAAISIIGWAGAVRAFSRRELLA